MEKSFLVQLLTNELFPVSNIVRRFTFKMVNKRDSYAILAKANYVEKTVLNALSLHEIAV
ncbi:MAG: hypothetical protein LBI03_06765 [Clostridiales bacterium]|jgi:hypothetical protein|nr:hypothetical protein [Clostridiales bacterium]